MILLIIVLLIKPVTVYNYILTTIGRGNCAMLVLLDLTVAFDTIDHDNLFCILAKDVGICGDALNLIRLYFFYNRTQRVQIENVLSDFANIICGVPQGSVLGHLQFFLYLLPLSDILMQYNICVLLLYNQCNVNIVIVVYNKASIMSINDNVNLLNQLSTYQTS